MVPRIITSFGIELTRKGNKVVANVRPLNLSVKGLCIQADSELNEDEILSVFIQLGPHGDIVSCHVKVVWIRFDPILESYYYGLGFVDLSDEQRGLIVQYVEQGTKWLLEFMSEFPLFGDFSEDDCRELLHIITLRDLKYREVLYRAGERDTDLHGLFIVQAGLVSIFKDPEPSPDCQIATVSAGQIFGETSLVFDQEHSATVAAVNDTRLIQISKAGFIALKKKNPQVGLKVMEVVAKALASRLGRTTGLLFRPL